MVVADASFTVIELLWQMTQLDNPICMITRFRLDAALYEPAPLCKESQKGQSRKKGNHLSTLEKLLADEKTR